MDNGENEGLDILFLFASDPTRGGGSGNSCRCGGTTPATTPSGGRRHSWFLVAEPA